MNSGNIELGLRKFDLKKIKHDSVVVIIAKRNSGKSFLVKDIMNSKRDIPVGKVVSCTDHLANFYNQFIPPMFINKEYEPEILDKIFERQDKAIRHNWPNQSCFLIFDDTLSDAGAWKNDKRIKRIFYEGRWFKIFFILTMQEPMGIPGNLRGNIDFTFILRTPSASHRKKIYENYAGMFPNLETFEKVLDACTENYSCLVIDNTTRSNNLNDQVFYYKAEPHPDLRMCSQEIWEESHAKYDSGNNFTKKNSQSSSSSRTTYDSKNGRTRYTIIKR